MSRKITFVNQPLVQSLNEKMLGLGSCFVRHVSPHFRRVGFEFYFSIAHCQFYHPTAIANALELCAKHQALDERDIETFVPTGVEGGTFVSSTPLFSMAFSEGDQAVEKLKQLVAARRRTLTKKIAEATHIFITLGTTKEVIWKESNRICARNNFAPPDRVRFQRSTQDEIRTSLGNILHYLKQIRSGKPFNLFLTVSPQQYAFVGDDTEMDPTIDSNLSKSHLIAEAQRLAQLNQEVHYFPSYEIVEFELRDKESFAYKRYGEDFSTGILSYQFTTQVVMERFVEAYFSENLQRFIGLFFKLQQFSSRLDKIRSYGNDSDVSGFKYSLGKSVQAALLNEPQFAFLAECEQLALCMHLLKVYETNEMHQSCLEWSQQQSIPRDAVERGYLQASLLKKMGRQKESMQAFLALLTLLQEGGQQARFSFTSKVLFTIGEMLFESGEIERARVFFQELLCLQPNHPQALLYLRMSQSVAMQETQS